MFHPWEHVYRLDFLHFETFAGEVLPEYCALFLVISEIIYPVCSVHGYILHPTDPFQVVLYDLALEFQCFFITHMLKATAAAALIYGTERLCLLWAALCQFCYAGDRIVYCTLIFSVWTI